MTKNILRIREVCREHHVKMYVVAERMGILPSTLSESLNNNPTLRFLERTAEAIGCDVKELFK